MNTERQPTNRLPADATPTLRHDRKPFVAPKLERHEKLRVVTAGSHDWGFDED